MSIAASAPVIASKPVAKTTALNVSATSGSATIPRILLRTNSAAVSLAALSVIVSV